MRDTILIEQAGSIRKAALIAGRMAAEHGTTIGIPCSAERWQVVAPASIAHNLNPAGHDAGCYDCEVRDDELDGN